jgi:hypothetical protein
VFTFGFFEFAKFSSGMEAEAKTETAQKEPVVQIVKNTAEADTIKLATVKDSKLFYTVTDGNIPGRLQNSIGSDSFNSITIGGKKYQPIYIGSAEAKVMMSEKLFQKEGDLLNNFFGNNVIVAGILPETKTILDNFHFVGSDFQIKK